MFIIDFYPQSASRRLYNLMTKNATFTSASGVPISFHGTLLFFAPFSGGKSQMFFNVFNAAVAGRNV
jgi:hypothetical protein